MHENIKNFKKLRLLYLQTPIHESVLDTFTQKIEVYTSGTTIASVLHLRNYDGIVLDMRHTQSMEVLENIKQFLPDRYVIACSSKAEQIKSSLEKEADAILLNPLDAKECERTLYKLASSLNMQEVFNENYYIDKLTSLHNGLSLEEKVEFIHDNALLKVSLHSFKAFQIYYGAQIANKVLIRFGKVLEKNLPVNAELFKTNEDEFSVLLNNPSPSQEKILSAQLKSFFEQTTVEVDGFFLKININIGIATGKSLIEKADIALCEAKEGLRIATYDEGSAFIKQQHEHIKWVEVIQEAISQDKIKVHYQPIMDNKNNCISKYEVLCRIEAEDKTLYQPQDFIPAAVIAGRMCDITRIVIDKSFKYFKDNDYGFSINITHEDFMAEYLVDFIEYKCDLYAIDPNRIYIEVLESISTDSTEGFLSQIEALKALGCNISIDDFGVDNSNFARMMQINAEVLKIDGHFIQQLLHNDNAKIIVENIVEFSRKIGVETVAEYVDSQQLQDLVSEMGINYSQGFHIGTPSAQVANNIK